MKNTTKWIKRAGFSICSLLLMISWNAFAQSDPFDIDIPFESSDMGKIRKISEANKSLKEELEKVDLNRITLQQMGDMNDAFILQFSDGDPNLAIVRQESDRNSVTLTQDGSGNASDIRQSGLDNIYSGYHSGKDIITKVIQKGNSNYIEQELLGNHMDFQIKQNGNNNEVTQQYGSDPEAGYKVIQKGNNMSIIIRQDQIFKK